MLKNLYCIVGHSGSGKTTIVEALQRRFGYVPLSSYTDRPQRYEGETGHIFVSTEDFYQLKNMLAYTVFNGYQYGATQDLVDHSDLYVIDPPGIQFMKEKYNSDRPSRVIGISASQDTLVARMRARGDSDAAIYSRLENDELMFDGMDDICDVIIRNDNLDETLETVQSVINHYEGIRNPGLQHVGLMDGIEKIIGGFFKERVCILFNGNKITGEEAYRAIKEGEYTPYALELPEKQFLGLFKDKDVSSLSKNRLFIDMDGTLCKWKVITQEEDLFSKGWFRDMEPIQSVVDAVNMIRAKDDVEVFIMTAIMEGSSYAMKEKKEWVKEHLPGFEDDHILFVPYGKHKHEFAPGGILPTDVLLDDYSWNLHEWDKHGIAVKIRTASNGTNGTWKGYTVYDTMQPKDIADALAILFSHNNQTKE